MKLQEREGWTPVTPLERQFVLEQLERIVASSSFRHSRRYPVLLRYVVERTLNGYADLLKERTLGIEVFQRAASYDTNLDPIVRITAGEVRKRIAQYYHEAGHDDELRIDLPSGSYVPVFTLQLSTSTAAPDPFVTISASEEGVTQQEAHPPAPRVEMSAATGPASRIPLRWIAALCVLALIITVVWAHRKSALNAAWSPMFAPGLPVLISIGEPTLRTPPRTDAASLKQALTVREHVHQEYVVFSDVQALSRITSHMVEQHQAYRLQAASETSFADLRQGPTVLIGGFDNPWTIHALHTQRFQFAQTPEGKFWIQDQRDPGNERWSIDFSQTYSNLTEDYAIVARFTDPDTHQPVMILAGIGENGTRAAGELLTDVDSFRSLFPGDGNFRGNKNFEAVIGAQVINGVSGPPKVLANVVW